MIIRRCPYFYCAHRLLKYLLSARYRDAGALNKQGKGRGLVRVSIGLENTAEDIDEFLRTLAKIIDDPDNRKFFPGEPNCRYCGGVPVVSHKISEKIDVFVRDIVSKVYNMDTGSLLLRRRTNR